MSRLASKHGNARLFAMLGNNHAEALRAYRHHSLSNVYLVTCPLRGHRLQTNSSLPINFM